MSVYQIKNNTEEMKVVSVNGKCEIIPESWQWIKVDKYLDIKMGQTPTENDCWSTEGIPCLGISDINSSKRNILLNNVKRFVNEKYDKRIINEKVLYMSSRATIGDTAIVNFKSTFDRGLIAFLNFQDNVDINYFRYSMIFLKKTLNARTPKGGIFKSLTRDVVENFEYPFVTIEKQQKIAEHLSFIEEVIFKTEKLISEKEKELRYYSRELLSGKLRVKKDVNGNIEFYDNTHWKTVLVNKKEVNIPEDWSVQKINNVTTKNEKSTIKSGDLTLHGDYPAFNCSKFLTKKYDNYIVDGENLFLSTGGMSSIHYYKGKCAYSTDVFSLSSQKFNMQYLYFILNNKEKDIDKMFYGSGLKHLNKNDLMNYDFTFTNNKEEQDLITSLLQDGEKEIEEYNKLLNSLKSRLKGDMQKLLTGESILANQIV